MFFADCKTRKQFTHGEQAEFSAGRGCAGQIFAFNSSHTAAFLSKVSVLKHSRSPRLDRWVCTKALFVEE